MSTFAVCASLMGLYLTPLATPETTVINLEPTGSSLLIFVPVKVNGQGPFQFVLDSGNARETMVSRELATKLALTLKKPLKDVYTVGLNNDITMWTIDSLEVGSLHLGTTKVGVSAALTDIAKQLKKPVDGNLGHEFLKNYAMTLDMKKHQLTLTTGSKDEGGASFKSAKGKNLILLDVMVGGKPFKFALDTGASYTCVSHEVVENLGLKEGKKFPMNNNPNELGAMTMLPSLSVAGHEIKDLSVVSAPFLGPLSEKVKTKIDGVIGRNFWSQFVLTIDYPHKKVRLS